MQVLDTAKAEASISRKPATIERESTQGAFFWLAAFYFVYCARPEDWVPGLTYVPLAKISAVFALLGLLLSSGRTRRGIKDLPREAKYFLAIVCLLFVAAILSPVWKGGAFLKTIDFSKAFVAWVLTFLVVTSFSRLRRIVFIQSISVVVISIVSMVKGHSQPRLEGVIGGIYSNPNDLAFAIVVTMPFCFAFLLSAKGLPRKAGWAVAMLITCVTLFMTGSRGGFIDLIATGVVCLWIFGIKGRRVHLVAAALLAVLIVGIAAGGTLKNRLLATSGIGLQSNLDLSAYESYEQRRYLMILSLKAIGRYPWGIGLDNFVVYSGVWREVHMSYLQIAAEGGIAALVLYLLFFARGFVNLKKIRQLPKHDPQVDLFAGALYASLVGFLVGALFSPEAYQFFPYFSVAYTSVLYLIAREKNESGNPEQQLLNSSSPMKSPRRRDFLTRVDGSPRSARVPSGLLRHDQ